MNKYGIIIDNGTTRKTLPLIEAESKALAILSLPSDLGAEVVSIEENPYMWNNCLYSGNAVGHSHGFCTADSCY